MHLYKSTEEWGGGGGGGGGGRDGTPSTHFYKYTISHSVQNTLSHSTVNPHTQQT